VPRNEVRSLKERILQKHASYLIPSYINDKEIHSLRDTGNHSGLLIDESLVIPEQIIPGKTVQLKGAFDTHFRTFPMAKIEFKCPRIGLDKNMVIDAVVTKFSDGLHCNIGNNFFTQYPFLNDIFQAHNCDDTRPRSAPASPPPEFTDTPESAESADTLIDCDGHGRSTTAGDVISPPDGDNDRLTAARCDNTAATSLHEVNACNKTNETGNNAADVFIEPRSPDAATKTKPNTSGSTVVHQPVLCSYGTTATAAKPTSATQTDTDCVSSTFDLCAQTSSDKQTEQVIE